MTKRREARDYAVQAAMPEGMARGLHAFCAPHAHGEPHELRTATGLCQFTGLLTGLRACDRTKNRSGPSHEMGKGKLHYFRYVIHSTMS